MASKYQRSEEKKAPIYERLADELYEKMQAGTAPWQPGFTGSYEVPKNFTTGSEYSGMNILKLASSGVTRAATFNQVLEYAEKQERDGVPKDQCIRLRKGSKGHEIGKVLTFEKEGKSKAESPTAQGSGRPDSAQASGDEKTATGIYMKAYHVFDINDFDNVPAELKASASQEERDIKGMQFANDIIAGMEATGLKFVESGNQPCYVPSLDEIRMPARSQYKNDASHAADALHEAAHATMHETRCNRPDARGGKFNSPEYAMEELRAEISAFFTACRTGHRPSDEHFESHASYTAHWFTKLKDDKREFIKAVGDARNISDYLIERGQEMQQKREAAQGAQVTASPEPIDIGAQSTKQAEAVADLLAQARREQPKRQASVGISM